VISVPAVPRRYRRPRALVGGIGFIAAPDGGVEHFTLEPDLMEFIAAEYPETLPGHVQTALGGQAPNRVFDTVLMGRATYDPALQVGITSPYPHPAAVCVQPHTEAVHRPGRRDRLR